ncbi:uncharacterized protein LOC124681513 isoform X2 [Lolium rigidum]|uniref:uncharacterized protein LOC124681513 isoform X2 n=1 Tax=Lolium rigidum TaxID=89674 RepID=UPI001F5C552A|nr:uncharacterized protein LOC124681513 isoform X2 [Lolium rigidum]
MDRASSFLTASLGCSSSRTCPYSFKFFASLSRGHAGPCIHYVLTRYDAEEKTKCTKERSGSWRRRCRCRWRAIGTDGRRWQGHRNPISASIRYCSQLEKS